MTFDWWTFGLQTVNAVVLVWLLARFLFRPVSRILTERQAAAHAALDEARATREAAQQTLAEAQRERDAVAAERAGLIAQAQAEAEQQKTAMLAAAQTEAEEARRRTQAELDRQRASETHKWQVAAGDLAAEMSRKVLARLPARARAADFAPGLAEAVAALPEATRARIGTEGETRLCAAAPLTPAEVEEVTERLSAALGHPVAMQAGTDPALIAGLELHSPHAVVRNTFRADLDRLAQRITPDDNA